MVLKFPKNALEQSFGIHNNNFNMIHVICFETFTKENTYRVSEGEKL